MHRDRSKPTQTPAPAPPTPPADFGLHRFALRDRDGATHAYTCAMHPADTGQRIMLRLLAALAEPLTAAVAVATKSPKLVARLQSIAGDAGDRTEIVPLLLELLPHLDLSALGAQVAVAIREIDDPAFIAAVLEHTTRDGQPIGGRAGETAYAHAYRGNYGELIAAVSEVVRSNGFLSVLPT